MRLKVKVKVKSTYLSILVSSPHIERKLPTTSIIKQWLERPHTTSKLRAYHERHEEPLYPGGLKLQDPSEEPMKILQFLSKCLRPIIN